ncbi:MAG: DUF2249 domain-containing protein, partial [Acidobacteriota bacterium]
IEVSAPHPVHTLTQEHLVIQENLRELAGLIERLGAKDSLESLGPDLAKLQDIAHHLVEAESHHQREEDVLFPVLEKHDIIEPPKIMRLDHEEFRKRKTELHEIAQHPQNFDFRTLKDKVVDLGTYLARELDSHIFKEDNILYQIALQVLTPEEWAEVKRECDKAGYCCFTPEEALESKDTIELDLRAMPPFERHAKIFEIWESLEPGQSLWIINDHDPKPLRYQFQVEEAGKFEWDVEEAGPKDWRVRIKRISR